MHTPAGRTSLRRALSLTLPLALSVGAACVGTSDDTGGGATTTTTTEASTSSTGEASSATSASDSSSTSTTSTSTSTSSTSSATTSSSSSTSAASTSSDTAAELAGCAPEWPATGPVQGSTPGGERIFTHVAFDPDGCDALETVDLYFFEAMPDLGVDAVLLPDVPTLRVHVDALTWTDGWIAAGPAEVRLYEGDVIYGEATGALTISALDVLDTGYLSDGGLPHWLSGELVVDAPGWSLHGTFTAPICWAISGFTLCP